jgi:ATP-binding cassette subfamily B protein
MSWILVVGVGTIFVVIAFLFAVAMPKFKIMQKLVDRLNLVMREIITGLPVIRAFSTVDYEQKRFDKANVDITKNSLFVNRVMTFMMPILMLIMNLISILILWVGAHNINDGNMQIGDMIAFIQYTMQIIMSFLMLTMVSVMLPRATVAAKRIDEILSTDVSIKDITTNETFNPNLSGVLEFRNVSFRYPNAEEDVLSNINFTAKPGETTAIIGSTGSGKSTLINLIPRFYDATAGSIFLDGVDITKVKQHALREKLGFIPQKGVLFTGTIESNINFGNASAPEEEMKRAARIAQAEEFIDSKPEGYQTPIAQGGTNVSGGQKQRLSIARAIARNPEVYVFDDSFSALDYKTDATLRKTIKEEISNSTILIVAQRISTIMSAEQILVLDDGRIVGKGTHKELLKNCEVYQQIASSQLSKEELEHE